ncbi:hypothetical protein G4B88_000455 [Cannabis sativa]|uniref:Uncharacterized protein n=1 Tax=Cannabis sativa TaxID=3483 RepID=A0A7J6EML4_CANSA|nr:hypothetical protein G4B88_000455 [Cannabis sativa]
MIDATAGAIAGGISRIATSPLDVIKIRFQVQLESTTSWGLVRRNLSGLSKYTGMISSMEMFQPCLWLCLSLPLQVETIGFTKICKDKDEAEAWLDALRTLISQDICFFNKYL